MDLFQGPIIYFGLQVEIHEGKEKRKKNLFRKTGQQQLWPKRECTPAHIHYTRELHSSLLFSCQWRKSSQPTHMVLLLIMFLLYDSAPKGIQSTHDKKIKTPHPKSSSHSLKPTQKLPKIIKGGKPKPTHLPILLPIALMQTPKWAIPNYQPTAISFHLWTIKGKRTLNWETFQHPNEPQPNNQLPSYSIAQSPISPHPKIRSQTIAT